MTAKEANVIVSQKPDREKRHQFGVLLNQIEEAAYLGKTNIIVSERNVKGVESELTALGYVLSEPRKTSYTDWNYYILPFPVRHEWNEIEISWK